MTSSEISDPAGYPPTKRRPILTGQQEGSLKAAARCADCISKVASQPALASVGPTTDNTTLLQVIEDLSRQVTALGAEQDCFCNSFKDPQFSFRDVPQEPSLG